MSKNEDEMRARLNDVLGIAVSDSIFGTQDKKSELDELFGIKSDNPTDFGISFVQRPLVPEAKPSDDGFLWSVGEGTVAGVLAPFRFIDPVDEFLKEHLDEQRIGDERVGYLVGQLLGFTIPSTAALKIGGAFLAGTRLIQTADAFADLGLAGNFARGAIAGGLFGAGTTDNEGDMVKNTLMGAATGGFGDLAMFPIMRGVSAVGRSVKETTLNQLRGMARTQEITGPELLARALKIADNLGIPDEAGRVPGGPMVESRLRTVETALKRMGLQDLESGQAHILPSVDADGEDIRRVLSNMDELDYRAVTYDRKGAQVTDFIVSRAGQLDDRLAQEFEESAVNSGIPLVRGQKVRYKGSEYRLTNLPSVSESGNVTVRGVRIGSGKKPYSLPIEEVIPDYRVTTFVGPKLSNPKYTPLKLWGEFVGKHGETVKGGKDWYAAAEKFLADKRLSAGERERMVDFLAEKQLDQLRDLDPRLAELLDRLEGAALPKAGDQEDIVAEMAAQTGYLVDFVQEGASKRVVLSDIVSNVGGKKHFPDVFHAARFIQQEARALPDLVSKQLGVNIPYKHLVPGPGAAIQRPRMALTLQNFKAPFWAYIGQHVLPRASFIREMEDAIVRQTGVAPGLHRSFVRVQQALTKNRLYQQKWIEELVDIRGGLGIDSALKGKEKQVMDLLSAPKSQWATVGERLGLGKKELEIAEQLDKYYDEIISFLRNEGVVGEDMTGRMFLEDYWPSVRYQSPDVWTKNLRTKLGDSADGEMIDFLARVQFAGENMPFENDPFVAAMRMMRSAHSEVYLKKPFGDAMRIAHALPTHTEDLQLAQKGLVDYLNSSMGQNPEAFYAVRQTAEALFDSIGVKLDKDTAERVITTIVNLNYGAFMAFRPGLALRNLTQTFFVTLPMLQDPVMFARGIKAAFTEEGRAYAMRVGAIPVGSAAAPMEDALWKSTFYNLMHEHATAGAKGKIGSAAQKVVAAGTRGLRKAEDVSRLGLSGKAGLYSRADEMNRAISFWSQRYKAEKALNAFIKDQDITKFNRAAGLDMFAEATTDEFHRILLQQGREKALDFIGTQMANETQWIYQLGAGPALTQSAAGRLFGQYGTWPSWMAAHMLRAGRQLRTNPVGAAKFWGWTAGLIGALNVVSQETGVNLHSFNPLQSMTWTGGPFVDYMIDMASLVGGSVFSDDPTPDANLTLGRMGLDSREGQLDVKDREKLINYVFGPFTPGWLAYQDLVDVVQAPTVREKIIQGLGFNPIAGYNWPGTSY